MRDDGSAGLLMIVSVGRHIVMATLHLLHFPHLSRLSCEQVPSSIAAYTFQKNSSVCDLLASAVNMAEHGPRPNLAELRRDLQTLSVPCLFPDLPEFDHYARSYNRVFSYKPAAICVPITADDISNAIHCARAHGLKVQPKSGGHSYGAYSSGGQDGSVIIHMKKFSSVELDTKTNVAVVGAGVRLGRLASELFRQGRRAVPHGTIQNVGVGGHFSHGGYGYQSRSWGLGLDTICGMDVVLADGRQVYVAADKEPELWFVCFAIFHSLFVNHSMRVLRY